MKTLNIVFLGTSSFALPSLKILAESDFRPAAVITKPDRLAGRGKKVTPSPVKKEALALNLEVFQPENQKELYTVILKLKPDLIVNVAYGMILPARILNFPSFGCINLHPSLLPAYRGAAPIQRALMAGEEITGITVMYMTEKLDAGDILLQEKTWIGRDENYGSLHERLANLGAVKLIEALRLVARGKAPRLPQDEEGATYAPPLTREDEIIRWSSSSEAIFNQIRALDPLPGAYTFYQGKRLKIWRASLSAGSKEEPKKKVQHADFLPGMVIQVGKDYFDVKTGSSSLRILELQPEGKRRMKVKDFLKGYSLQVGESLG